MATVQTKVPARRTPAFSKQTIALISCMLLGTIVLGSVVAFLVEGESKAHELQTASPPAPEFFFDSADLDRTVMWLHHLVVQPMVRGIDAAKSHGNDFVKNEKIPKIIERAKDRVAPYIGQRVRWRFRVVHVTEDGVKTSTFPNRYGLRDEFSRVEVTRPYLKIGQHISLDHAKRLRRGEIFLEATIEDIYLQRPGDLLSSTRIKLTDVKIASR